MSLVLEREAPPLREDKTGAIRVGHSRVLLETVIRAFQDGESPESIVQQYSTLTLSDTYNTLGYYLRHQNAVENYLSQREHLAGAVRQRLSNIQPDLSSILSHHPSRQSQLSKIIKSTREGQALFLWTSFWIRLRHIFFRYSIFFIIGLFLIIAFFIKPQLDSQLVIAVIGAGLSFIYFIQKQKLEELSLFRDLFEVFNQRYSILECGLVEICEKEDTVLGFSLDEEKDILTKYFNLCSEEFLYYRLGYIYPEVWQAWLKGMQYYYCKSSRIRNFWDNELSQNSYYGMKSYILNRTSRKAKNRGAGSQA